MFISLVEKLIFFPSTISMGVINTFGEVIEHPLGSLTFTLPKAPSAKLFLKLPFMYNYMFTLILKDCTCDEYQHHI